MRATVADAATFMADSAVLRQVRSTIRASWVGPSVSRSVQSAARSATATPWSLPPSPLRMFSRATLMLLVKAVPVVRAPAYSSAAALETHVEAFAPAAGTLPLQKADVVPPYFF
jgi:cytochrome c-type biogenesis protein CcmH/NrfG